MNAVELNSKDARIVRLARECAHGDAINDTRPCVLQIAADRWVVTNAHAAINALGHTAKAMSKNSRGARINPLRFNAPAAATAWAIRHYDLLTEEDTAKSPTAPEVQALRRVMRRLQGIHTAARGGGRG